MRLGSNQRQLLRYLAERERGEWYPGCGWHWGSYTDSILYSMVKHGLVERLEHGNGRNGQGHYKITDAGRAWVEAH